MSDRDGNPNGTHLARPGDQASHNVVATGPMLRLMRHTTDRSLCYSEMFDRCCELDRTRVSRMEAKLFQAGIRLEDFEKVTLSLPTGERTFEEGRLSFYYSADCNKFILDYFELWGGGGGFFQGRPPREFDDDYAWIVCGHPRGIAAQSSHKPPFSKVLGGVFAGSDGLASAFFNNNPVRSSNELYCILPDWSLLAKDMRVPEEFDNPFARSVFVGEALCRLTNEISRDVSYGRMLEFGPGWKSKRRIYPRSKVLGLYNETVRIIDIVGGRSRSSTRRTCFYNYITGPLVGLDILGDDRRTALVGSEITFRLACEVGRQALYCRNLPKANANLARRNLFRRFSSLADFAEQALFYFTPMESDRIDRDLTDELCRSFLVRPAVTRSLVIGLADFGLLTGAIVDRFAVTRSNVKSGSAGADDLARRGRRLIMSVASILGVSSSERSATQVQHGKRNVVELKAEHAES